MEETIKARIDKETKKKAQFVLKCKGSSLSEELRRVCEALAKVYDEANKEKEDTNEWFRRRFKKTKEFDEKYEKGE